MSRKKPLAQQVQIWADARRRHRLSHAHVQMARELGLNPQKLGKLDHGCAAGRPTPPEVDNHAQEPWKRPLPEFIEHLYRKRFGRARPENVVPIEEQARRTAERKAERKAARAARRQQATAEGG